MSQLEIERSLQELNHLVINGKLIEAFDKFYHDDVVMQENAAIPTVTKAANRQRELEFLSKLQEFRHAEVKGLAVHGNFSFVIWRLDYTHSEWGRRDYTQVSVQEWKDGKIINEKFIYVN